MQTKFKMRKNASLLLSALVGIALADKDDSYYIAGTGNPNVNEKMYWKDAENVLQDLNSFSYLYVEFHHCAWSWMQTEDSGNDVEENDYWYMGKIPPMGANVAYSLYGVLKGSSSSGCGKDTFINSFYTNTGFTNFTQAMYYASASGFSKSSSYSADCYGGYGVGCDYSNGFALHSYGSNECNPQDVTGVLDELYDLNQAMSKATCVKIYDSSKYKGYVSGTPLELLDSSSACFYQNFWSPDGECPDPYGLISYYQQNFYNGIKKSKMQDPYNHYRGNIEKGEKMVKSGQVLLAIAAFLFILDCFTSPGSNSTKETKKETNKELSGPQTEYYMETYPSDTESDAPTTPTIPTATPTADEVSVQDAADYTPRGDDIPAQLGPCVSLPDTHTLSSALTPATMQVHTSQSFTAYASTPVNEVHDPSVPFTMTPIIQYSGLTAKTSNDAHTLATQRLVEPIPSSPVISAPSSTVASAPSQIQASTIDTAVIGHDNVTQKGEAEDRPQVESIDEQIDESQHEIVVAAATEISAKNLDIAPSEPDDEQIEEPSSPTQEDMEPLTENLDEQNILNEDNAVAETPETSPSSWVTNSMAFAADIANQIKNNESPLNMGSSDEKFLQVNCSEEAMTNASSAWITGMMSLAEGIADMIESSSPTPDTNPEQELDEQNKKNLEEQIQSQQGVHEVEEENLEKANGSETETTDNSSPTTSDKQQTKQPDEDSLDGRISDDKDTDPTINPSSPTPPFSERVVSEQEEMEQAQIENQNEKMSLSVGVPQINDPDHAPQVDSAEQDIDESEMGNPGEEIEPASEPKQPAVDTIYERVEALQREREEAEVAEQDIVASASLDERIEALKRERMAGVAVDINVASTGSYDFEVDRILSAYNNPMISPAIDDESETLPSQNVDINSYIDRLAELTSAPAIDDATMAVLASIADMEPSEHDYKHIESTIRDHESETPAAPVMSETGALLYEQIQSLNDRVVAMQQEEITETSKRTTESENLEGITATVERGEKSSENYSNLFADV